MGNRQECDVLLCEVRFYAELNDYLPPAHRFKTLNLQCVEGSSLREIIRDLQVPSSLIDLVLVNGDPVDLSYVPQHGDMISMYPVFETFDISRVTKVHPRPLRQIRFVLDVHLGKLARNLRMFGFDTVYREDFCAADLLSLSMKESRILLSRNKALVKSPQLTRAHHVRSQHPVEQLREIFERFDLYGSCVPLSRCLRCNILLQPLRKSDVISSLPPRIAESMNEFRHCPVCGRTYWEGSHYSRMKRSVEEFLASAPHPG